MKEIIEKINELFVLADTDDSVFNDEDIKSFSGILNKKKKIDELIYSIKKIAQANNTLLGRTIQFPMADSFALYIVTKINKRTVTVKWIDYMDGWVDDRLRYEGYLNKDYAEKKIIGMDRLHKLFSKS